MTIQRYLNGDRITDRELEALEIVTPEMIRAVRSVRERRRSGLAPAPFGGCENGAAMDPTAPGSADG